MKTPKLTLTLFLIVIPVTVDVSSCAAEGRRFVAERKLELPEGQSRYALYVLQSLSYIQPGDSVEVICIITAPDGTSEQKLVLRNMLVIGVDSANDRFNSVLLAVTPVQALYISRAERRGEIKLQPDCTLD